MISVRKEDSNIFIKNSDKKEINFNIDNSQIILDGFEIDLPGEYEKGGILLEAKSIANNIYYSFSVDSKHLVILDYDNVELTEKLLNFLGDIDILLIKGTKLSAKLFDNLEAKLVIPYGQEKDIFLSVLGQQKEETSEHKVKGDIIGDITEFVNLV